MKSERIYIRITPEEKKQLQLLADNFGMSISQYIRFKTITLSNDETIQALNKTISESRQGGSDDKAVAWNQNNKK